MKKKILAASVLALFLAHVPSVSAATIFDHNLSYGTTGDPEVSQLQQFLTEQGLYSGPISGNFFSLTRSAVEAFQKANGLPSTGYFGPLSQTLANKLASNQTASNSNLPAGCTLGSAYSATTGQVCLVPNTQTTISSVLPAGCTSTSAFSTTTGQSCLIANTQTIANNATAIGNQILNTQSTTPSTDYSTYTPIEFSQYQNDSAGYSNQNIILTGMNDSFIPSTGSIGSTNFVEVENPFDLTQPKIELEVDDSASYTALVNALQDKSQPIHLFLRAYGVAVPSQTFTSSNLFRSAMVQMPVLQVSRVDQCMQGTMNTTVVTGTSFESNFFCSSWSTIVPMSSAGTIYNIPVPVSTTSPITPVTAPVTPSAPSCNLKVLPGNIGLGQSSELLWTSTNATSGTIETAPGIDASPFTVLPNGSMSISPSISTMYMGMFNGPGGEANCQTTINVSQPAPALVLGIDATLKDLTVNGTTVTGFSPSTDTYTVTLPAGTVQAPSVTATVNDPTATDTITQAANSLGTATVVVVAQNGTTQKTYTINFRPSDSGQCNFNGNIFYCEGNPSITVSPTTLPNATVGTSYSQAVSITDSDTSSQNFRWNIISGDFPPGMGFAFSSTQALECTGTYCSFVATPSGVSVNGPGAFFGTPTTAGTYTFTLQAIDTLNYVVNPTFTITVGS